MSFRDPSQTQPHNEKCGTPDVVLITAMFRERTAAIAELRERGFMPEMLEYEGRYYHRFVVSRSRKPALEVWLAQPTGEGAQTTHSLLDDVMKLTPKMILMVGVAGGVQGRVNEGDVVMARQIHNYEPGKDTTAGFLPRTQTYRCSAVLTDLANALHASGELASALDDSRLHTDKDYASGEKVLMNPKSSLRQQIEAQSVDIIAFETEGHGMLHPLWERERKQLPPIPSGLIKTVTDLGDSAMAEGKEARQRIGSLRAMRVALALVPHL